MSAGWTDHFPSSPSVVPDSDGYATTSLLAESVTARSVPAPLTATPYGLGTLVPVVGRSIAAKLPSAGVPVPLTPAAPFRSSPADC